MGDVDWHVPIDPERALGLVRFLSNFLPVVVSCADSWHFKRRVFSVAWSPDGVTLASGSADKTIKVWNTTTGKCHSTLTVDSEVSSVAFSPDGSKIATAHANEIQIFDTQTQGKIGSPHGHSNSVISVAWNNDGSKLASGSYDSTVRIWSVGSAGTFECQSYSDL